MSYQYAINAVEHDNTLFKLLPADSSRLVLWVMGFNDPDWTLYLGKPPTGTWQWGLPGNTPLPMLYCDFGDIIKREVWAQHNQAGLTLVLTYFTVSDDECEQYPYPDRDCNLLGQTVHWTHPFPFATHRGISTRSKRQTLIFLGNGGTGMYLNTKSETRLPITNAPTGFYFRTDGHTMMQRRYFGEVIDSEWWIDGGEGGPNGNFVEVWPQ